MIQIYVITVGTGLRDNIQAKEIVSVIFTGRILQTTENVIRNLRFIHLDK